MENLILFLEKHKAVLKEILILTKKIKFICEEEKKDKIDEITFQMENRQRLINLLGEIQGQIEKILEVENFGAISLKVFDLIKMWQLNFNKTLEVIAEVDQEIVLLLENSKEQTTQELSGLFKNKESFKGYNLQNVKK